MVRFRQRKSGTAMERGSRGGEHFLKELVWREFAYHLIYHTPHITERNWREGWDGFPWQGDGAEAEAWKQGRTGEPMVDAGMRELYVTGTMHNRVRMLVASYPAANAMGWQWVAGSGPDAAPFFRIFNPSGQGDKFDGDGSYRRRYLAGFEGSKDPVALSFFEAIPRSWNMAASDPYPERLIDLAKGRERALGAYKTHTDAGKAAPEG